MKKLTAALLLTLFAAFTLSAQRQDLTGLKICIDPGHGGHNPANDRHVIPDAGIDFWESESNFQKALLLKALLEARGATVLLTRNTNDYPNDEEPSLSARVEFANTSNADWFHSIHSNATGGTNTGTNYTLMLIREKRPGGPASGSGNGLGVPEQQASWDISDRYIGPSIRSFLRTQRTTSYLDWTFYGGTSGGFSLGVLRGLVMPGELSEGSFHDYYPETRRLMNNDYRKMEAYAIRNSFLQYYSVPADTLGIVAGIQTDIETGKPVNGTTVHILPEDRGYTGDSYNNGFYMFDRLAPGPHTVRFESSGYVVDSVTFAVASGGVSFIDRTLMSTAPPRLKVSTPADADTNFSVYNSPALTFSKPMDTSSVRTALSLTPAVELTLQWSSGNRTLTLVPSAPLTPLTSYVLKIDSSASDIAGYHIDGNGDGVAGDPMFLRFRTLAPEGEAPSVIATVPAVSPQDLAFSPHGVISILFDRLMDTTTITSSSLFLKGQPNIIPTDLYSTDINGKTLVTLRPRSPLPPRKRFLVTIQPTVRNRYQITMKTPAYVNFTTGDTAYSAFRTIESFAGGTTNWQQPSWSGSTTGIIADSTRMFDETSVVLPGVADRKSMGLRYAWNTRDTSFLIREYLFQGAPYIARFDTSSVLQAFVFGDSSRNKFRFCIDDSTTLGIHRVSAWTTIDWFGWKLLEWKLSNAAQLGFWLNPGNVTGPLERFDSFQFSYDPVNGRPQGAIYIDELRVNDRATGVEETAPQGVPDRFQLAQNYPNPFNPTTTIVYMLPQPAHVKLTIFGILGRQVAALVDGSKPAGTFTAVWDASAVPAGVYFARLDAASHIATVKMLLVK